MTNKRITDADFIETLNSDESFFVNRNNTLKQISKEDIVFNIVNGGTGAVTAEAARKNLGVAAESHIHVVDDITNLKTTLDGKSPLNHSHDATDITSGTMSADRLPTIPIANGGTNATNGATGLKNLFAAGNTVLSSYQFGSSLPSAGTYGRIFFKKVSS